MSVDKTLFPFTRALQLRPGVDPVGQAIYLDVVKRSTASAAVEPATSPSGMPNWALALALGAFGDLVVVRQLLARALGRDLHSPSSLAEDLIHRWRSREAPETVQVVAEPVGLRQSRAMQAAAQAAGAAAGSGRRAQAGAALAVAGLSLLSVRSCALRRRQPRAQRRASPAVMACEPVQEETLEAEMNMERLVSTELELNCPFYRISTEMPSNLEEESYKRVETPEIGCVSYPVGNSLPTNGKAPSRKQGPPESRVAVQEQERLERDSGMPQQIPGAVGAPEATLPAVESRAA